MRSRLAPSARASWLVQVLNCQNLYFYSLYLSWGSCGWMERGDKLRWALTLLLPQGAVCLSLAARVQLRHNQGISQQFRDHLSTAIFVLNGSRQVGVCVLTPSLRPAVCVSCVFLKSEGLTQGF